MTLRRLTAVLLVIEAVAITTPVSAIDGYVIGSQTIGKAIAYVPVGDVMGQGVAQALTPLAGVLLVLAAWGVWHAARGVGALLLQPAVLAFALVPFLVPLTSVDVLPGGPLLLAVLVVLTGACLVGVIAAGRPDGSPHGVRRWWWLAAFTAGIVLAAAVGAGDRALPSGPAALLASPGEGASPPAGSAGRPLPQNPGLAANPFNSIHNDSWATDSYPRLTGPAEVSGPVDSVFTGGDCATIAFDSAGRIVTLCSSLTAVIAYVIDADNLSVVHQEVVGSRTPDLTDFSGGGYFVLDSQDRIVFPAANGVIRVLGTRAGIEPLLDIPVGPTLRPDEKVTSVMPGWRNGYWYVGSKGTVGVVRDGEQPRAINLGGESIENSFAVARDGVYVVTGEAVYRLTEEAWTPAVVWRTAYDAGERHKPGQTSKASGTTPTVFAAGRYVALSDNADPRMNVVVLDTATGSITCRQPVFGAQSGANENSLIAAGTRIVVENNYGYRPPITSTAGGHSTTPGLSAIDVDPRNGSCRERWTNDTVVIPSLVSKATLPGNQVLTYTKAPDWRGVDAWYFTGIDLDTGDIAWRRLAGTGIPYNNHYASTALSPAGDLLVGTVNGIVRLRNG